jgi:hypothetical protein
MGPLSRCDRTAPPYRVVQVEKYIVHKRAVSQEIFYRDVRELGEVDLGVEGVDRTRSTEITRGKSGSSATVITPLFLLLVLLDFRNFQIRSRLLVRQDVGQ